MSSEETVVVPGGQRSRQAEPPGASHGDRGERGEVVQGDLSDELLGASIWTDEQVTRAGIPTIDVPVVSIGGGIGSFCLVDFLRIAGVPKEQIKVLTSTDTPWTTYQFLTRASQIPDHERLRSDSQSTPDNAWGFPAYAMREAFSALGARSGGPSMAGFIAPLYQVLTEPILTDYYTPRAGQVFDSLAHEARRIGWTSMTAKGAVRMVRRRVGGGYFTILTPPTGATPTKRLAYRSRFVHVAVGYPGLRFLPDLQDYRQRYGDHQRVVNAYENHEHVYQELVARPGVVVVRGGGIVASRVLQRLIDDRDHKGAKTQIAHLFRHFATKTGGPNIFMRRKAANGWNYQGFNWPKATWGGQLKATVEHSAGDRRKALYELMGGTTTPHRKLWVKQLERGRSEGWYKTWIGEVKEVVPGDGVVVTRISTTSGLLEVPANFVIDATGLEADIGEHRLLADLLEHSGAKRNVLGRLEVNPSFEVQPARSEGGRLYAVGSATLGNHYCGVDSFLGLQFASLSIADDMARTGFCHKIGPLRSLREWWRWMTGGEIP